MLFIFISRFISVCVLLPLSDSVFAFKLRVWGGATCQSLRAIFIVECIEFEGMCFVLRHTLILLICIAVFVITFHVVVISFKVGKINVVPFLQFVTVLVFCRFTIYKVIVVANLYNA